MILSLQMIAAPSATSSILSILGSKAMFSMSIHAINTVTHIMRRVLQNDSRVWQFLQFHLHSEELSMKSLRAGVFSPQHGHDVAANFGIGLVVLELVGI